MKKITFSIMFVFMVFGLLSCTTKSNSTLENKGVKQKNITYEGLVVFGEVEYGTIKPGNIRLKARIDTGATTSSIHATGIKLFDRDGKKWVKFNLVRKNGEKVAMKKPVIRIVEIKRHGAKDQHRPVVKLDLTMGPVNKITQFSLTDRSKFTYPILIGRSFLKNVAIVDVNRSYTLSPLNDGGKDEK
jgi:hypothetical protein